jgi:hypothetical protein
MTQASPVPLHVFPVPSPSSVNVASCSLAGWATIYWRAARLARSDDNEVAMGVQAMLWQLVTAEKAPKPVRMAADSHLRKLAEHPDPECPSGKWSAI